MTMRLVIEHVRDDQESLKSVLIPEWGEAFSWWRTFLLGTPSPQNIRTKALTTKSGVPLTTKSCDTPALITHQNLLLKPLETWRTASRKTCTMFSTLPRRQKEIQAKELPRTENRCEKVCAMFKYLKYHKQHELFLLSLYFLLFPHISQTRQNPKKTRGLLGF